MKNKRSLKLGRRIFMEDKAAEHNQRMEILGHIQHRMRPFYFF
jgi:hypothetical protein